jgi:excisionase family DNA binding protein
MTVAEAAAYLRMTTRNIRNMMADGRLTGYAVGGRLSYRLRRDEVENLMHPAVDV